MKFHKNAVEGYLRGARMMMDNLGFECHSLEWRWHNGTKGTTLGIVFQRGEPGDDAALILNAICLNLMVFEPRFRIASFDKKKDGMWAVSVLEVI